MQLTVQGRAVFATTGGRPFDAARPAIVFLHGVAMDHTVWALQSRFLAHRGHAVLAPDLPGCGRSAGPHLDSIAALADWTVALLDAVGAPAALLVGHSMGGLIALETAARHSTRVRALALVATMAPMAVQADFMALARAGDHKALELMNDWSAGRRMHVGGQPQPGLWQIGAALRSTEQAPPGALAAGLAACAAYTGGPAAAAAIACPTTVILGERDQMTPLSRALPFARSIPGAEIRVLPGAGHMLPLERPDDVLDGLRRMAVPR